MDPDFVGQIPIEMREGGTLNRLHSYKTKLFAIH